MARDDLGPGVERRGPVAWAFYSFASFAVRNLFWPNRLRVSGLANIPASGPFIYAPNHVSYADPPVAGCVIAKRRHLNFMAKADLFRIPLLGPLIRVLGAFPVRRGSADRRAIRHAVKLLQDGQALLMFPEGTRAPDESALLPGETGVAYIAALSGAPVIPVGLIGTDRVMPKGTPFIIPRRCEVRIGQPLALPMLEGGNRSKEALEQATYEIMAAIARLVGRPHPGVKGAVTGGTEGWHRPEAGSP